MKVQRTLSPSALAAIRWISWWPESFEVLLLLKFICISSCFAIVGEPWAKWCCGVASGTRRRRKPEVQPHGTILKNEWLIAINSKNKISGWSHHLTANKKLKYHGINLNLSFFLTASMILSATSFEFSVFTHLGQFNWWNNRVCFLNKTIYLELTSSNIPVAWMK